MYESSVDNSVFELLIETGGVGFSAFLETQGR